MNITDSEEQFKNGVIELSNESNLFIIVGSNNSGKSTLLRSIAKTFGNEAYRVDVNRTVLQGEGAQNKDYKTQYKNYISQSIQHNDDNTIKYIQTLQDYFNLDDAERQPILEWYNQYFPNNIYEERENKNNSASPMLLKINGFSITKQGSGMRATIEIFIKLFDSSIKYLCIDEPELGLEPRLQKFLFQAIKDKATPEKKIFIATHSHHFLDYNKIDNNYICQREENSKIYLDTVSDLEPVIFKLLGNTLSGLFLPEKVLVLEGPSDINFLDKVLSLTNKKGFSFQDTGGIGSTTSAIQAVTQFLKFTCSAAKIYKDKTFVIIDNPTKVRDVTKRGWEGLLTNVNQICTLSQNGIEYYYPERILQEVFNTSDKRKQIVEGYLLANPNEYNGIRKSKTELSKMVAEKLISEDIQDTTNELLIFVKNLP